MKDVSHVWYTQWKGNRPVQSIPIEWEEFMKAFLGKYFPRERRMVKVKEFINLKQGNLSVDEYSLKFSMFSKYALSLLSDSRYEMSRFVIGVADLVREKYPTTMLHDDMTLARLMVYAQEIEESRLKRSLKTFKGVVQVIVINLGSKRGLKLKKNLGELR